MSFNSHARSEGYFQQLEAQNQVMMQEESAWLAEQSWADTIQTDFEDGDAGDMAASRTRTEHDSSEAVVCTAEGDKVEDLRKEEQSLAEPSETGQKVSKATEVFVINDEEAEDEVVVMSDKIQLDGPNGQERSPLPVQGEVKDEGSSQRASRSRRSKSPRRHRPASMYLESCSLINFPN